MCPRQMAAVLVLARARAIFARARAPPMLWFLSPLKAGVIGNPEVTRPLTQKIYRSLIMLYTSPFGRGDKILVDRYQGVVQGMGMWYLRLKSSNKTVFIPTSFIYDKPIELFD